MPLPVLEPLAPLPKIKKKVKKAVPPPPPTQPTCTPPPLPLSPPSTHQVRCGTHPLPSQPKPAPIPSAAAATATARAGGTRVACGDAGGGGSSERRLSVEEAREKEVLLRTASPSREDWNGINPFSRNPTSSLPITTLTSLSTSSSSATATQRPQHQRQSSASSDSSSLTALTEESQQLPTPSLRDEAPLPPVAIAGLGSPILLDNAQLPKPTERVTDDDKQQQAAALGPSHVQRHPLPSLSTVRLETPSALHNVQLPTPTSAKPTQQDDDSDDEFDEELPDDSPCSSRQRRVSSPPSSRSVSPSPSAASVREDDAREKMGCEGRGESGRKRCRDEYEAISEEETAQDNERLQALYANASSDVRRKRHATIKLREALARAEEEQEQAEHKNDDVKAFMLTHYGFTPADEDEEDGLDVDMEPDCDAKMEEA